MLYSSSAGGCVVVIFCGVLRAPSCGLLFEASGLYIAYITDLPTPTQSTSRLG
jgi:hypothetical protein